MSTAARSTTRHRLPSSRRAVDHFYDVQVKTVRLPAGYYTYFRKSVFDPRHSLLATLVVLRQGQKPQLFLIPSVAWLTPDALLSDKEYEGKKSHPEWGIRLVPKNLPLLDRFTFEGEGSTSVGRSGNGCEHRTRASGRDSPHN